MDIAFVSNVVFPFVKGGAEKRIHEVGRRLAADGHDVTIYARHFWDGPAETTLEGMRLRAVAPAADLYSDDRRSIREAVDFGARLTWRLRRAGARADHDVIDVSVFPYFPVLGAVVATLGRDVPIVTTWHEVWRDYWEEYLGALAPFGKAIERTAALAPQHPTAVSELTADRLATIGPSRDAVEVVPNGIDVDAVRSAPRPSAAGEASFDVLFVGRLIPDKNVHLLLRAFDEVATAHDATLGVVGDGPELDRLRDRRRSLDHPDRVRLLGFLEADADVFGHMRDARVFASLSAREGFGIAFVEAMAADCTVVAGDHPNSNAAAVVGDAGFTVPLERSAVADALGSALAGERPPTPPTTRAARYDWDVVAERALEHYRTVSGRRTGSAPEA